ncbi:MULTISPECIES: lipopolysaccharide biosynthesis protein [unclassified Burkholderia]|uniref:lipopolysaccharide biosynthesis protein n=1 Tax=unclassified Burkholderia TaxID=2613784 RepID=UPI000F57C451|nr:MULTISPECIES: lipopolysaccharide biosynthesis protein [unclassified Burkholderia]
MTENRVIKAFFAHGLGPVVSIFAQVVSIPLFLSVWGAAKYGEWILISTIPTYLALSDLGLSTVAANEMDQRATVGDYDRLQIIYRTLTATVALFVSFVFIVSGVVWWAFGAGFQVFQYMTSDEVRFVALILICDVCLSVMYGPNTAALRSANCYALSIAILNSTRFMALAFGLVALLVFKTPVAVALGMTVARLVGFFVQQIVKNRYCPWATLFPIAIDWAWIKKSIIPSLAFLGFPLSNGLNFQGVLWVIGTALGPAQVTVFSTMRTLTRVAVQMMNLLSNSVWSEVSKMYATGKINEVKKIKRRLMLVTILVAGAIGIGMSFLGERFYESWTGKHVSFDSSLFDVLLLSMIANSMWQSASIFVIAINRHMRFALAYLISAIGVIVFALVAVHRGGLLSVAICLLGLDIFLVLFGEYEISQKYSEKKHEGPVFNR